MDQVKCMEFQVDLVHGLSEDEFVAVVLAVQDV